MLVRKSYDQEKFLTTTTTKNDENYQPKNMCSPLLRNFATQKNQKMIEGEEETPHPYDFIRVLALFVQTLKRERKNENRR